MKFSIVSRAGACVAVVGVGLAFAAPASAEAPSGTYTTTVTEAPPIVSALVGESSPATFTSCGPDCVHLELGERDSFRGDLHLQGNSWVGTRTTRDGAVCTWSVDSISMVLTDECPIFGGSVRRSLTKIG